MFFGSNNTPFMAIIDIHRRRRPESTSVVWVRPESVQQRTPPPSAFHPRHSVLKFSFVYAEVQSAPSDALK